MKKLLCPMLIACVFPISVVAATRDDYARQWSLQLQSADAGAYRVVLDEAVYRQLHSPVLADLDVVDAQGQPVPAALFAADGPTPAQPRTVALAWFPLPADGSGRDVASISEIATDGSVRRVEWRVAGAAGSSFLLDASRVDAPLVSLRMQWAPGQAPFDLAVRVSASDDLKDWRTVADEAHLVELSNAGERVLRDRIDFAPVKARYLRVAPLRATAPPIRLTAVTAGLETPAVAADWQWRVLQGRRADAPDGTAHYEFELDGRFPMAQADVVLPGNSTGEWRLEARDDVDAPWRPMASWTAFRIEGAGNGDASPPQALPGIHRDRRWRLTPARGAVQSATPQLRLGYRPEALVFVAQGSGPFALVAGSARASRADAPLARLIDAMRSQRGEQWQPASATLGAPAALAGASALTPAPAPRDWKTWLLWSVLVLGAMVVAGFALSLLRRPAT